MLAQILTLFLFLNLRLYHGGLLVLARMPMTVDDEMNSTYMAEQDEFLDRLFNGYRADKRPSSNGPLDISFSLYLHHLSISKVQNPTVRFNSIMTLGWYDDRLGWNPADEKGKMISVVPSNYRVWMPLVNIISKGYSSRIPIYAFKSRTVRLRVTDPERYQRAKVTMSFRFDGAFDCQSAGSFPFEKMNCFSHFLLLDPTFRGRMRVSTPNLHAYSLAPMYEDEDSAFDMINGWEIRNGLQKIRYFDPFNATNIIVDEVKDNKIMMSLVECRLELLRAGWTLPIVVLSSVLISAIVLIASWITPSSWSIYVIVSLVYTTSICVRLALGKVIMLSDSLPGLDMFVIVIWISSCVSLLFHLIIQHFPYETKQRFLVFSPILSKWQFFKMIENILTKKNSSEILSLELEFIRTMVAFLLLGSLCFTLIRMS
ncbi:unnamed protein product [Auanema sp. JU1783]|nr:unnamed protein product [Auanema sp. JU1783]